MFWWHDATCAHSAIGMHHPHFFSGAFYGFTQSHIRKIPSYKHICVDISSPYHPKRSTYNHDSRGRNISLPPVPRLPLVSYSFQMVTGHLRTARNTKKPPSYHTYRASHSPLSSHSPPIYRSQDKSKVWKIHCVIDHLGMLKEQTYLCSPFPVLFQSVYQVHFQPGIQLDIKRETRAGDVLGRQRGRHATASSQVLLPRVGGGLCLTKQKGLSVTWLWAVFLPLSLSFPVCKNKAMPSLPAEHGKGGCTI